MIFLKKYFEYPIAFTVGGALYSIIEVLWRGRTHWTMAIAGGICFVLMHYIDKNCCDISLAVRCFVCAIVICTVEFAFGFAVNMVLGWNVWDYSGRWLNLYGQICPLYALLWFLIGIPGNIISKKLGGFFSDRAVDESEKGLIDDKERI